MGFGVAAGVVHRRGAVLRPDLATARCRQESGSMEAGAVVDERDESYPPHRSARSSGTEPLALARQWLLAIPHFIVLAFLWLAFAVLTFVAFFAILFTGRYPGACSTSTSACCWTWRVAFYSYGALGTDRYPLFTLDAVPDYPATLDVAYPSSSRGARARQVVAARDPALPARRNLRRERLVCRLEDRRLGRWHWGYGGGLVGLLVFFAGVALLFTTRYPRGIFDFVLGLDRWVARVIAYAGLMTDRISAFRLDQGGTEGLSGWRRRCPWPPWRKSDPADATRGRRRRRRIVLLVLGSLAALLAFGASSALRSS